MYNEDDELDYEDDSSDSGHPSKALQVVIRPTNEIGSAVADDASPKSPGDLSIADHGNDQHNQSEDVLSPPTAKKRMISLSDGGIRTEMICPDIPATGSPAKRKAVKDRLGPKDQVTVGAAQMASSSIEQTPVGKSRDPRLVKAAASKSGGDSAAPESSNVARPTIITSIPRLSVTSRRPSVAIRNEKPEFRNVPADIDRNAKLPPFLITPTLDMYGLDVIFPNLCRSFASGNCYINESRCSSKHEYPKAEWVANRLEILNLDDVIIIFKSYILRNKNFIQRYFQVFCKYFGKRKLRDVLHFATEHCQRAGMEPNLHYVVDGFMEFGMSYTAAILDAFHGFMNQPSTEMKFTMLDLILDARNQEILKFLRMLKILAEDAPIRFECKHLLYLLNEYKRKPNGLLKSTIWSILTKCATDNVDLESIHTELEPFLPGAK